MKTKENIWEELFELKERNKDKKIPYEIYQIRESKTYNDILKHRLKCNKWGKGFCLDCFGGGLIYFESKLIDEFTQRLFEGRDRFNKVIKK